MNESAGFLFNAFTAPSRERTKSIKSELKNVPMGRVPNEFRDRSYATNSLGGRRTMTGEKYYHGLPARPNAINLDHWTLRHNVRNLMYESNTARGIVERFAQFEAGTGLKLRVNPMADILGISEEEAKDKGNEIARRFHLWASDKKCSVDHHMNLYEAQNFYSRQDHRDNDIFQRFKYSRDARLLNPLQFQFLDPDQIQGDSVTPTDGSIPGLDYQSLAFPHRWVDDGIIKDNDGKEIAYKVRVTDKHGRSKTVEIKRVGPSGRIHMIHAFKKDYAGQTRGFPRMSHAIQSFADLTGFTIAQIQKAINQSNFAFYTKPSEDADASNPLEEELSQQGPRPSDYLGSEPGSEEVESITDEEVMSLSLLPEFNVTQPGSMWVASLKKGEDVVPIENTAPADRFDAFVDSFVAHLAASCDMPMEMLLLKFGNNYSASRATMVLFWQIIEIGQANMAWDWLNPMVEMWLSGEIAAGRLALPGWSDPRLRQAWMQCRWIGTPMPEIDQWKAANAKKVFAELGSETLDDVALNHNGSDGKANRAQLTKEFAELPIPPWSSGAQVEIEDDDEGDDGEKKKEDKDAE